MEIRRRDGWMGATLRGLRPLTNGEIESGETMSLDGTPIDLRIVHSSEIADDPAAFEGDYVPLEDHQAEISRLRALCQPDASQQDAIESFWFAVKMGWDIEPREYFEREYRGMFTSPLSMAVHYMWKRHAKEWPNAELAKIQAGQPDASLGDAKK